MVTGWPGGTQSGNRRRWPAGKLARSFALGALAAITVSLSGPAFAAGQRDVLWEILGQCLDPGAAFYCTTCRAPLTGTPCATARSCAETSELWAQSAGYVALRDRKMCGCPDGFVHGLVVPRARVTGVEDPRRPDGIWAFAWGTALQRIGEEPAAALVVNPAGNRGQDQLHVHVVRLQKDARRRFAGAVTARILTLGEAWGTAARIAAGAGLADYGVLVASHPEGGFLVVVDRESPEKKYALERCR